MTREETRPQGSASEPPGRARLPLPGLADLFVSFLRLGAVSFGGPAMVTYIQRLAVTRRGWLSAEEFRQGVALCQAVPGATAMQCAAYIGLRTSRLAGAVVAYAGFGLPAFLLMFMLATAYGWAAHLDRVVAALTGLRALVVALMGHAAWSFGRMSVRAPGQAVLALAAAGLFLIGASPLAIVLATGLAGAIFLRPSAPGPAEGMRRPPAWRTLALPVLLLGLAVLLLAALWTLHQRLAQLALVMMKVDLLAFGGGFSSVPLMFREIVEVRR